MIKTVFSYADGSLRASSAGFGSLRVVGTIADVTLNFVMHSDELWHAVFSSSAASEDDDLRWQHARSVVYGLAMLQLDELRKEGFA